MDIAKRETFNVFLNLPNTPHISPTMALSLLDYLEVSFLPRPTQLQIIDQRPVSIQHFTEAAVKNALRTATYVELERADRALRVGVSTTQGNYISIRVAEPWFKQATVADWKAFALYLIEATQPLSASAGFEAIMREIVEMAFGEDTPYEEVDMRNWEWINYLGAVEWEKCGGAALLDNPYLQIERLRTGQLVQIGDNPYDVYTPTGRTKYINAVKAMPPYQRHLTSKAEPEAEPSFWGQLGQFFKKLKPSNTQKD